MQVSNLGFIISSGFEVYYLDPFEESDHVESVYPIKKKF